MASPTASEAPARPATATRIVGIGASAGGLAPLEEFFSNVEPHSNLAYVVVQHLDPTHKAMLAGLLQRTTAMAVREAQQDMPIEPDCVYVIPPSTEISVIGGRLHLEEPSEPRGLRLPINVLFSSLAVALGERAIGVVLSGMGSDGTLGLQAIKSVGGLTLAQHPDSAEFDSMPANAIAADCACIVDQAGELPGRIMAYIRQRPGRAEAIAAEKDVDDVPETSPIKRIFALLHEKMRHDFSLYKPSTLNRRIERRMAIHQLDSLADYVGFLEENEHEIELLFKELLIGVTSFFRDAPVWERIAKTALPELLEARAQERSIRAWVVGCSTGEEAYTLAMLFSEIVQKEEKYHDFSIQIFATDLSPEAIATARRGRYPDSISKQVSAQRIDRFFSRVNDGYRINSHIRDMVLFAEQDVVLDPPFTKLDLISCRNLLIYFDADLQKRLIPLFHYSLRKGGMLLLGTAETTGSFSRLFTPVMPKLRLYRREDNFYPVGKGELMASFPPLSLMNLEKPVATGSEPAIENIKEAADHVLLQVYAPAAVLVNADGDILYISGRTGKYLEPAAGKANWNLHAMARDGLRGPIAAAIKASNESGEQVHLHGLRVLLPGGGEQSVDVTVQTLREPASIRGNLMIVFRDIDRSSTTERADKERVTKDTTHLEEIQQYSDEINTLREEARANQEELQSANEELQSTNEELTTSKEEMQSMNEELQTINSEMQTRLDDLALAQCDMQNLLNSVDIAIIFLDKDLNVRRYTTRAARLVNIRESDIGRPFSDLTTLLDYPELGDDITETLNSDSITERQVRNKNGNWFAARMIPYRTLDDVRDGVVITFVDITDTKKLEQDLRRDLDG